RVGEGGAHIRLLEDQQHGNGDEGDGLEDVPPGEFTAGQVGAVAGHEHDEDQLDPFRGLEVDAAGELDPSLAAHHAGSEGKDADQGEQAEAVDPVDGGQELVIVDDRHHEHGSQATGDPEDLHLLEAVEFGVERGAVDFKDADNGKDQHEAEERPVEVAEGEEAAHKTCRTRSARELLMKYLQRGSGGIIASFWRDRMRYWRAGGVPQGRNRVISSVAPTSALLDVGAATHLLKELQQRSRIMRIHGLIRP